MDQMTIKTCLALFDSNTPKFFEPCERDTFEEFLKHRGSPFLILSKKNEVFACGGYTIRKVEGEARLRWGMVRNDVHKNGLGQFLLAARLRRLLSCEDIHRVIVSTTHLNLGFYQRFGFREDSQEKNFFRDGLHLHNLSISRSQIECLKFDRNAPDVEFAWANLNSSISL